MVLGAIYSFFRRAARLFIRAAAWLIIALSLWIPLLYSVAFLIVCASIKKNPAEVSTVFWAGLAVSIVAAFFLSGVVYERRHKVKKAKKTNGLGERVQSKDDKVSLKKKSDEVAEPLEEEPISAVDLESNPLGDYGRPVEAQFISRRDSFGDDALQKPVAARSEPRIFATRKDPTIFIYEYPDRLEFYKRTRTGMILMETRYRDL